MPRHNTKPVSYTHLDVYKRQTLTTLAIYVVSFTFLYHYLPDRQVQWRQAFLGGAITAALFVLGRYLIGLYIAQAAPGSAYGSMGALVILLVWMYYAAVVFFVGALLTAVIDERARAKATPVSYTHLDVYKRQV